MLLHYNYACCNHTGRDCLCSWFPSPRAFSFRAFSISQNLFWLGPWLFPPLFLWCFIFLFIHLHMSLHKPVALCLSMPCKCFCFEMCWPWRSLMFLSPDTINKCTCGILHDNSKQYEGEVNIIMEKTIGFRSNLDIKRAGVKCLWFFWFPFKVWRREDTSRLGRSWEILRRWEDTAKMISGAVELRGLNVLMKVKTETTGKSACFSVLQVHEDPRWDYEWPNRPPRAPWIPGTGWTNIPRRWVLKELVHRLCGPMGETSARMAGTVWEGKQQHRSSTWGCRLAWRPRRTWSTLTKQTNRQKWCWQKSKGEKAWTYALLHCSYKVSHEFFLSFWFVSVLGFFFCCFFPNKHAVWLSLSHIGQDVRLCFFFFGRLSYGNRVLLFSVQVSWHNTA